MTKLKTLPALMLAVTLLGGGGIALTCVTLRAEQKDDNHSRKAESAAPKGEKPKSDEEALQGTWVGVLGERDGRKLPRGECWKLVVDGNKATLRFKEAGQEREGTYTLDPDKTPKAIDLTLSGLALAGIYELKGSTLKTIWREKDRPADFDSSKGFLMVFEKMK